MPENRQRFSKSNSPAGRSSPVERRPVAGAGAGAGAGAATRAGTGAGAGPRAASAIPGPRSTERPARYGASFEARFGRVILQHGIAAIPSALFHYQGAIGLKAQHVWFIAYILSHKWDEDLPYPSLSNMARCSGVTLRNIQFIKSDLCQAGMLAVSDRYNSKGGRDSNAYDFSGLFAHLEDLISEDAGEPGSPGEPNRIGADIPAIDTTAAIPTELDSSFVARFGRVIARRGVAAVPRAIFTHQKALGLTPQQVWFVSYIFSFQWTTALPYPSINRMVQHTGYSRAHLHTIKAELVEAGYLRLVHRTNEQGGQDSNGYDFSGLLDGIRARLQPDEPLTETEVPVPDQAGDELPPLRGRHLFAPRRGQGGAGARQKAGQLANGHAYENGHPYEAQRTGGYESQQTTPHERERTGGYESQQLPGYETEQTPPHEARRTGPVHGDSPGAANRRRPGAMKRGGHEIEPDQKETTDKIADSNQRSPGKGNAAHDERTDGRYSPYIAAIASDFSREMGDSVHEASNMRQALNLWQGSGLREEEFVQLMQEARKLTRRYQSRPAWDAMGNKMAYYFSTLRDLLKRSASS